MHPSTQDVIPQLPSTRLFDNPELHELINSAGGFVARLPVALDASNAADAQELLADIVKLMGMIDKERVKAKDPYLQAGKNIDAAAKKFTKPLDEMQSKVRGKLQEYQWEVERVQLAAQQKIREAEAEAAKTADGRTPALAAAAAIVVPEAEGIKTRTFKELVIDEALLPAEYLIPDETRIRAELARGKVIPGAKFVDVQRIVAR